MNGLCVSGCPGGMLSRGHPGAWTIPETFHQRRFRHCSTRYLFKTRVRSVVLRENLMNAAAKQEVPDVGMLGNRYRKHVQVLGVGG
jgi:hypothetical protein